MVLGDLLSGALRLYLLLALLLRPGRLLRLGLCLLLRGTVPGHALVRLRGAALRMAPARRRVGMLSILGHNSLSDGRMREACALGDARHFQTVTIISKRPRNGGAMP